MNTNNENPSKTKIYQCELLLTFVTVPEWYTVWYGNTELEQIRLVSKS